MTVVIKKCKCDHDWQDKQYGPKMRLHNKTAKKDGEYRCSVCSATQKG